MNQEIKIKWLEALRSGKYKQGVDRLRTQDDRYCCLGVLCDVIDPSRWVGDSVGMGWSYDSGYSSNKSVYLLTGDLREKASIDYDEENSLANMNDMGSTFEKIADYIEKRL